MGRTRGSRIAGATVLIALVASAAVWAVAVKSPLFDVRDLKVEGVVRVSSEEIAAAARVEEGSNLLLLSVDRVAASVRANPWVEDVVVRRDLPSTLVVEVLERTPVGWVAGPEGGAVVAADGTVLRHRDRGGLAVLGRVRSLPQPGERVEGTKVALGVAASLPPRLRREVARVVVEGDEVRLRLRSAVRVLYGEPEALAAKHAALEALLAWVGEQSMEVAYLDVRAPGTPALRPAERVEEPSLRPQGEGEDPPEGSSAPEPPA